MSDDTEPGPDERTCPECGAVVHRSADFCPECDVSLYREKVSADDLDVDGTRSRAVDGSRLRWTLVALLVALVVAAVAAVVLGYVPL